MQKQLEIMKQALSLTETVQEGIIHIQSKLNKGHFSETMYLFEDVVRGFTSIETAINQLDESVTSSQIFEKTEKVKKAIELVVDQYELHNTGKVQEIVQFTLIPVIKKWRTEMEQVFHPYILH